MNQLEAGQAEYKLYPIWQKSPLIIRGDAEEIRESYEQGRAEYDEYQAQRRSQVATKVAGTAVEAVQAPLRAITDTLGTIASKAVRHAEISLYDHKHGTRFGEELKLRRQQEKDLAMARKLGLLSADVCQKHRHGIAAVKRMR
jgi:hypothetical protein